MAQATKAVTRDPWNQSDGGPCIVCCRNDKRRPTLLVMLSSGQLQKRANFDTAPFQNPFVGLEPGPVSLCTSCRSPQYGWAVISDPGRHSAKSRSALKAWMTRVQSRTPTASECCICCRWRQSDCTDKLPKEEPSRMKANLQLFSVLLYSKETQERFCADLSKRSGCRIEDSRFLLVKIADARFCPFHHNQTRHARDKAARGEPSMIGIKHGFCTFKERGCSASNNTLRQIPSLNRNSLEDIEAYIEYRDAVSTHSSGTLSFEEVVGKQACGHCRYVLSKGAQGTRPNIDAAHLKDVTDRCLVDCVMYALDLEIQESVFVRGNERIMRAAMHLRSAALSPFPDVPESRFVPVLAVLKLRKELSELSPCSNSVANTTAESRIGPVLAAKNVHIYSLSRKLRCYAVGVALSNTVGVVLSLSKGEEVSLMGKEKRKLLAEVGKHFTGMKVKYRRGEWCLSEEIESIPSRLWASFILDMASEKLLAEWKVAAAANNCSITTLFPVCNLPQQIPRQELDDFAGQHSLERDYDDRALSRADFVLCIRSLKVIEQFVYSRSRLSVGPLTMTLSIAGISESTASWTSVLHALGLVTSYDSMVAFRKGLIAEREQATSGAFENIETAGRIVAIQSDNFDILPFHSVKAAGKALPIVSGTATQGIVQTRKPQQTASGHSSHANVDYEACWRDPMNVLALATRSNFASSFSSAEDQCILDDFFDLVFGVVHFHRDVLLGVPASVHTHRRGTRTLPYKNQGINFRALLTACFKPHGGLDKTSPSLFDQDVVFVDISCMSAADILTIHQKLALIKNLLRPGEDGCVRFSVVSGDQPTYQMIVKIWRQSYLDSKKSMPHEESFMGDAKVHEWLIPFPGFFHVEKQSLYPLCKEMLHGLGLEELAACSGLSQSQVDNILKHSHARNNRAVFLTSAQLLLFILPTLS